jgi:hypothetical protein
MKQVEIEGNGVVSADSRFSKYKDEIERGIRKADIKLSPLTKRLLDAFTAFCKTEGDTVEVKGNVTWCTPTRKIRLPELVEGIDYRPEDVASLAFAMGELQEEESFSYENASEFLSHLIQNGPEGHYVIPTRHFSRSLDYFCTDNDKDITIEGNIGMLSFLRMKRGHVIIKEDVTGGGLGRDMEGGRIDVEGTLFWAQTGDRMSGGEIYLHGKLVARPGARLGEGLS